MEKGRGGGGGGNIEGGVVFALYCYYVLYCTITINVTFL